LATALLDDLNWTILFGLIVQGKYCSKLTEALIVIEVASSGLALLNRLTLYLPVIRNAGSLSGEYNTNAKKELASTTNAFFAVDINHNAFIVICWFFVGFEPPSFKSFIF